MPGTELEVAILDAGTTDPLAEVLRQVGEEGEAVMLLGIERAVHMGTDDAPILRALNLERSEWPERLRRPVVLWIPESVLGALGRTAPDFLDWRSDTLHFPVGVGRLDRELVAFDTSLWQGGVDRRMPARDRRGRVHELRSRLCSTPPSTDLTIEKTRASWLFELGNHLLFFGEIDKAEDRYKESLAIAEQVGDRFILAGSYHQLGRVAGERGRLQDALEWYRKSLQISEEVGYSLGMAMSYHQLGIVAEEEGRYDEAINWYQESLAIKRKEGDRSGMAATYHQLGNLSEGRGSLREAVEWYRKSLRIKEDLADRGGMASSYHQLGIVAQARGSFEEALDWYRKSLEIAEELGYQNGIALTSSQIGALLTETGPADQAVQWSLRALTFRHRLAVPEAAFDLRLLRRQREALGDERFRELVEEHADTSELAAYVLEAAEPLDEPAQVIAETPADYGAGGRSDGDD